MIKHVKYIISELNKIADTNKAEWWNNYLRNEIKFIGVRMPENRNIIQTWYKSNQISVSEIIGVADDLMSQKIAEYKLAAILIHQNLILGNIHNPNLIKHINNYFCKGYIFDWNTCDWLSVRVLTPIIDEGDTEEINIILNWSYLENYWQARAALVSFAQCENLKYFIQELNQPMQNLIQRPQRFAKTSVGWMLRQISKFDQKYVEEFLARNKSYFTKEVINNALKYSDKSKRKKYYEKESNH